MSGRDIDADYARLHGIEEDRNPEESQLVPTECPRCGAKNSPVAKFCQNCGQALSTEAYEEIEEGEKWIETLEGQDITAEGSLENILEQMVERKIKQVK